MAQCAEAVGFDSLWVPDHLMCAHPATGDARLAVWECWSVLAALAATTNDIELGTFVACTSFRNPALLAKMADTVDEISNGRLILGLGAGWMEAEFRAFGYPFDNVVGRFEEALQIIHPLLRKGAVDFKGKYYEARECELLRRGPRQKGPPIMIGAKPDRPCALRLTAQYDRQPCPVRLERKKDRGLETVGVLILVDQNVVEPASDISGKQWTGNCFRPVEQQVIVIEDVLRLLGFDVSAEQVVKLRFPTGAPRKMIAEHGIERLLGIDRPRVNRKAGAFGGELALRLRKSKLVADQIHQVSGILPVMDRKVGVEPNLASVFPQKPRSNAMERPRPGKSIAHYAGIRANNLSAYSFDASSHLGCCPA